MAKLLFIQNLWYEFMGPMLISTALKRAGHNCAAEVIDHPRQIDALLDSHLPDIVGLPVMAGSEAFTVEMCSILTRRGVPTLLGGTQSTLYPQHLLERTGADFLCRGSGETAVVKLLDAFTEGTSYEIEGVWQFLNGRVIDRGVGRTPPFAEKIWADRELYRHIKYFRMLPTELFVTRSCPNNCSYCFNRLLAKCHRDDREYFTRRPIDDLLEEAVYLRDNLIVKNRNKRFFLRSDNINCDDEWFERFLEQWPKVVGAPFNLVLQVDRLTAHQAKMMKIAGVSVAAFGIESGNENLRRRVLNRRASNDQIFRAASWLRQEGIKLVSGNMLAIPGETLEQGLDTLELNQRIGVNCPHPSLLQPYPGTRLHSYAVQNGYLPLSRSGLTLPTLHHGSLMQGADVDALVNLHRLFILAVLLHMPRRLVRFLARVPRNPIYDWLFLFSYSFGYVRPLLGLSWSGVLAHAFKYVKLRPRRKDFRRHFDLGQIPDVNPDISRVDLDGSARRGI